MVLLFNSNFLEKSNCDLCDIYLNVTVLLCHIHVYTYGDTLHKTKLTLYILISIYILLLKFFMICFRTEFCDCVLFIYLF